MAAARTDGFRGTGMTAGTDPPSRRKVTELSPSVNETLVIAIGIVRAAIRRDLAGPPHAFPFGEPSERGTRVFK
jgi:hypothetical protein